LSTEEIDRLLQHREKGNYINSAKEFQKVTHVSDSLLNTIEPYFKFPDWVTNKETNNKRNVIVSKSEESSIKQDLNTVTAKELRL